LLGSTFCKSVHFNVHQVTSTCRESKYLPSNTDIQHDSTFTGYAVSGFKSEGPLEISIIDGFNFQWCGYFTPTRQLIILFNRSKPRLVGAATPRRFQIPSLLYQGIMSLVGDTRKLAQFTLIRAHQHGTLMDLKAPVSRQLVCGI